MRTKLFKRALLIVVLLGLILAVAVARPLFHLAKTAWRDVDDAVPPRRGNVDDASRLNETPVAEVWEIPREQEDAERQLAELLQHARTNHLKVSIAGARHTMGGHTIARDGVVIDMLPFDRMELDAAANILWVQAGARWSGVIRYLNARGRSVQIMQSNDDFSVGGSLSVNCHGWQINRPPIASSVESFRLMLANGKIVKCSRTENSELFSLALGGYGLFGVILDANLRVARNEKYRIERLYVSLAGYAQALRREIDPASDVGMAYGRICVAKDDFLKAGIINVFHRLPGSNQVVTVLGEQKYVGLKRALFRGSVGDEYGKQLRWSAEKVIDPYLSGADFDRNGILYEPAAWFSDRSQRSTDILMECFVASGEFELFVDDLRKIIPETHADLLNITVRDVKRDDDTFLHYADKDMFSLVMLFNQERAAAGEEKMQKAARQIIAATLRRNGKYYLPYRLHATPDQFAQAYPQGRAFFEAKRKYDPEELFENAFYRKYGLP